MSSFCASITFHEIHSIIRKKTMEYDVIVVGAGIVGCSIAYAQAKKGKRVALYEREERAIMASVRNFGMIWPIGQPEGPLLKRALDGRKIWEELASEVGFWFEANGSLHLAYHELEESILKEFIENNTQNNYSCSWLDPGEVLEKSPSVRPDRLRGAMWSSTEALVDPREVLAKLPGYLATRFGVDLHFNEPVIACGSGWIDTPRTSVGALEIYICSGADFQTLYPRWFAQFPLKKCKLQMMRTAPQPDNWRLGPSLCGGLTLLHYSSFSTCRDVSALKSYYLETEPRFEPNGIHVMAAQNGSGEVIIGDSHHYNLCPDPFDSREVETLILQYLRDMVDLPMPDVRASWHGVYPKLTNGLSEIVVSVEPNVWIVNGLGGAGMTLSPGLAFELAT